MQLHITRAEKKRLARPPGLWGAPALHIFALPIEACGQRVHQGSSFVSLGRLGKHV